MVERHKTNPLIAPKVEDGIATQHMESEELSHDVHEKYLERLQKHYNLDVNQALIFYVESHSEPILFVDKDKIMVGRQDSKGRINPEFDLNQFDGAQKGVSRIHAKIAWDGERYLIQDVASTNGTRLNGKKMVPYQYMPLTDGATLQFGSIAMTAFVIIR